MPSMNVPWQELIERASAVRLRAHAPYSHFSVGACLLDQDGNYHDGCNVENVSFGLTICAERSAVFGAVSRGVRAFARIAIVSPGGVAPCGACRQVLAEFCDDLPVCLIDSENRRPFVETALAELLPMRFNSLPD